MKHSGRDAVNSDNSLGFNRARLLNILMVITIFGLLGLIVITQLNVFPRINWDVLWPEITFLAIIVICYLLNRAELTLPACLIFLLSSIAIISYYIYVRQDVTIVTDIRGISPLMAITVIAAGMIMGSAFSFVVAGISVFSIVIVGLLRLKPTIPDFHTPLDLTSQLSVPITFLFMMAGLSWLFETRFSNLIKQLESKNNTLDAANIELARRHEIEHLLSRKVDALAANAYQAFEKQNHHSTEQINAVLDVTTTIRQLEQISRLILEAGKSVNTTAQDSMSAVTKSSSTLRDELTMLNFISEQSQMTAHSMQELFEQTNQINQIIELITEIADETSLVALNATIEAAGAGQYGRRFAAVANEVQRLASRSRQAADQVQDVVKDISTAIEKATSLVQKGADETREAMSGSRLMEQTLEEIVNRVNGTGILSQQIFRSVEQQQTATAQVAEKMRAISALSQAVTQDGNEMRQSLEQLKEAIAIMQQVAPLTPKNREDMSSELSAAADSSKSDLSISDLQLENKFIPNYLNLPFDESELQQTEIEQDE